MIPNDEGRKSNGSRHDRKVPAHDRCAVPLSAADKFVEIKNRSNNLSQRRKLHNIVFFACRSHTDRYRFFRRSFIFLERFKIEIIKLS